MKYIAQIIAIAALVGVMVLIGKMQDKTDEPQTVSSSEATAVENVVISFGQKLKLVSLTASPAILRDTMEKEYGPYVTAELIEQWLRDPENAPGRLTSSPTPDSIDIVETRRNQNGSYTVEGNIIETAVDATGAITPAFIRPATITLEKRGDNWMISDFLMKASNASSVPQRVSLTGTYVCLPHRNTTGPQTLECALGMKTDAGVYYAVNFNLMSQTPPNINTGERFSANGTVTPVEALSSTQWQKYNIEGIFSVTDSFKKLSTSQPSEGSNTAGIPDLISVGNPTINQKVSSPLTVTGSARGPWYFEASFPIELRNAAGNIIAQGPAEAQSNWMTEDFVIFKGTLTFPAQPAGSKGTLILRNSNASGDPERDRSVSIPVTF